MDWLLVAKMTTRSSQKLGLPTGYQVAQKVIEIMTGLQGMDPKLIRQYSSAYGPFAAGDYQIGQELRAAGVVGEVIWSYHSCDGRGLVYVVDDATGWPTEVLANEVQA